MRKLGICVLLAGAVASFPAVNAQDGVADDAPPTGEIVPTELVDPQPDDGGEIVDDNGEIIDDGGEIVDDGGEIVDDNGEVIDDSGEIVDDGGEIVDDNGEIIDDGGEIVDDGGEVIDDGGEIVDENGEVIDDGWENVGDDGEVIDDGGEIVDDGGEVIDDGGEIVDDAGEVIDDGGEVIVDRGGEIKVGEVVGDGTVGEVIYYTMTPGDGVNPEVVRDDAAAGGDPVPVEGQLPTDDGLMYATGAPTAETAAAGPLESRDAASDTALPAEVDDAARVNDALPANFPAPMDVMDSEHPKH